MLWWPMLGVRRRSWIIIIVTFFVGVHIWLIFRLNIYRFIVIRNVRIIGYSFPTSFLRLLTRTTNFFPIDEFSTAYGQVNPKPIFCCALGGYHRHTKSPGEKARDFNFVSWYLFCLLKLQILMNYGKWHFHGVRNHST